MFELSGPAEGYVSFALSRDKWMVSFITADTSTLYSALVLMDDFCLLLVLVMYFLLCYRSVSSYS